jgi:competence protein ComEC
LPALRNLLAESLLSAAGTNIRRIRATELAATLAVGRRDLVPRDRRDGWRRSGLAHVLAVSGLHVGLVGGLTWLIMVLLGATPKTTRLAVLAVLPTYALLAGGSPSATRAALMGMVYLGARLAGRALVPMAAVLLTAFVLLLVHPPLVGEISFQLTVLLTAALVRWGPPIVAVMPAPRWLAAIIAVPLVAQLAAAPLVAHHFEAAIPGAMLANLAVPFLLGPMVLAAVAATAMAPLWPAVAGWLTEIVGAGGSILWHCGIPGRAVELVPPALPTPLLALLVVTGLAALLPGRWARAGTASYLITMTLFAVWWLVLPAPPRTEIELLPVSHGLAMRVGTPEGQMLMDGGGRRREAATLLARSRTRRLSAVIASHSDEDHIAGLGLVLRTTPTDRLILPGWMLQSGESLSMIRVARRHNVEIVPVARGSTVDIGPATLEVLWPPASDPPEAENERSLVARLLLDEGTVLLTSDIGRATELRLLESSDLDSTILLAGHHGSRHSSSPRFLDAVDPRLALIPAGEENLHHHPHPEVLARLDDRGIGYRMPIRDGRCGARFKDGKWELYP